jgi:hypothetical protein
LIATAAPTPVPLLAVPATVALPSAFAVESVLFEALSVSLSPA